MLCLVVCPACTRRHESAQENVASRAEGEPTKLVASCKYCLAAYPPGIAYCADCQRRAAHPGSGAKLWETDLPLKPESYASPPAIGGDSVFIGSNKGELFCLDTNGGALLWQKEGCGSAYSAACAGEKVLATCWGKIWTLRCLSASTGETETDFALSSDSRPPNLVPALDGGRVYAATGTRHSFTDGLTCWDAGSGTRKWRFGMSNTCQSPTIAAERVYVGSWDGSFYCLDKERGSALWRADFEQTKGGFSKQPPAVAEGKVFVMSGLYFGYAIICLAEEDGRVVWRKDGIGFHRYPPAVHSGRVYFATQSGAYCVDAQTGRTLWRTALGNGAKAAAVSICGNVFVTGTTRNGSFGVWCLHGSDGTVAWEYDSNDIVEDWLKDYDFGGPPVVVRGRAIACTDKGKVICLDAGEADGWPMLGGGPGRTGEPSSTRVQEAVDGNR
ncbi:MAG: PQQ-binding-like beta-propeller repeat protein [Planctomycetota bacterium]|nr:PQQ-binding-like beta-propeller repeat protein [Planctomycetota bacterium]